MRTIFASIVCSATLLASGAAFAQGFSVTGVGDASAQNQLSTVGVGRQTGSGGPGYRYGHQWGYADPYYSGRSAVVVPYGYGSPYYPD